MLTLRVQYGQLAVLVPVRFNPHVQQALGHEAEDAGVVGVVAADVQPLLQLKEDVKEPHAISIELLTAHDKHVEAVTDPALHGGVEGIDIRRTALPQDLPRGVQVDCMVGVGVLAVVGLNPVIAGP